MCQNVIRSLIPGIGTGPQKTSGSVPVPFGVVVRALPLVKEGVTVNRVSEDPPHMSYRWNQLCEMSSAVLFSKKSAKVGFWPIFSDTQVVPCVNGRKSRFWYGRGGRFFFEKNFLKFFFVTLATKYVQNDWKNQRFPDSRFTVTPSLKWCILP